MARLLKLFIKHLKWKKRMDRVVSNYQRLMKLEPSKSQIDVSLQRALKVVNEELK
ncbi:hypothetical protein [Vibrio owensii]|uniref:hypothetical protein n=1 Tax=Vibrio harveyi group TaxID=717610 RepID=UPI003CC520A6